MNEGTRGHPLHRKPAVHSYVSKSRKFWRFFIRLNRLCLELGLEYDKE